MMENFPAALDFVWLPQNDDPGQGYHITPGDPGLGTFGGITEATWQVAMAAGFVTGSLMSATRDQLSLILRRLYWGSVCDALPAGVDLVVFNGRMMSGGYPHLFQLCVGFTGNDVDGWIGPDTIAAARGLDAKTLIHAQCGMHWGYLFSLPTFGTFGNGWTKRLLAAKAAGLELLQSQAPVVAAPPLPPTTKAPSPQPPQLPISTSPIPPVDPVLNHPPVVQP